MVLKRCDVAPAGAAFHGSSAIPRKSRHGAGNGDLPMRRTIILTGTLLLGAGLALAQTPQEQVEKTQDRKSTRLNSSHSQISYAVFCLKKKKSANSCRP